MSSSVKRNSRKSLFSILKAFSIISFVKNSSDSQRSRLLSLEEIYPILDFWQSFENKENFKK